MLDSSITKWDDCSSVEESDDLTICIAAQCVYHGENAIVMCRDWQANQGTLVTSDDADKFREFKEDKKVCSVLLAGSPTRADDLLTACEPSIRKFMRETDAQDTDLHIDGLLTDLRRTTRAIKKELIEHFIGMTLGMDFEEFKQRGSRDLRESHYDDIWHQIKTLDLGAELLINLFDAGGDPFIIRLDMFGEPHDEYNYSTIGSGGVIARAFLSQVDFSQELTFGQCVYEVLRAKFASEMSRDVGRGTSVDIVVAGSKRYSISRKGFKFYRPQLRPYKVPQIEWSEDFIDLDDKPLAKESESPQDSSTDETTENELPSQE